MCIRDSFLISVLQDSSKRSGYLLNYYWGVVRLRNCPVLLRWSVKAVSYTHLDVYKRQELGSVRPIPVSSSTVTKKSKKLLTSIINKNNITGIIINIV